MTWIRIWIWIDKYGNIEVLVLVVFTAPSMIFSELAYYMPVPPVTSASLILLYYSHRNHMGNCDTVAVTEPVQNYDLK